MSAASSPTNHLPERLPAAIIVGCAGTTLSEDERRLFHALDPLGFILFARNCETPDQITALTKELRACVGRADTPILIDQEGGRVARLLPPHWPKFPPMQVFGDLARHDKKAAIEACRLNAQLIGHELAALGITVNCAPVVDVPVPGAHDVIGDRALGRDPLIIADLGRAVCEGLLAAGVTPIIKHMPGHGRAMVDSHLELPSVTAPLDVLQETDFLPFYLLRDQPWAMVAHVLYTAVDDMAPATTSPRVVTDILRGAIGFDGILIADDIGMAALGGTLRERAIATLACGMDLTLHCSGILAEMIEIAPDIRQITLEAKARLERPVPASATDFDAAAAWARLKDLLKREIPA